ncbi:MAG: hypothetical protein ACP5E3_13525, partial [Bacteroidales bacterium]
PWTDELEWNRVIAVNRDAPDLNIHFNKLQDKLVSQGGGVIYFPPGEYHFKDHILVKSNIIIRGADPLRTDKFNPAVPEEKLIPITDARDRRYELKTILNFPEYDGIDRLSAFKGIRTKYPDSARNIGILNLEIRNGHIYLGNKESLIKNGSVNPTCGNILVYGNILKNSAVAGNEVPVSGQQEDQIWMARELGAITIFAGKNILVANNRIPKSGESNFLIKNYRLYPSRETWEEKSEMTSTDLWFDYDNRSGIRVNYIPLVKGLTIWKEFPKFEKAWKDGGIEELVTPGSMAKGVIIRENYVFSSGKGGIKATGWGTRVSWNVIRCFPQYPLPSYNGIFMDAFVNDVRAVEVRGWEWIIEGNDFEVYSNYTPDGVKYNDGEGLMHESWENIDIRNSIMRNNVGNQYLCFWRVPVNGLLIEGNRIRTKLGWHAIFVNSQTRFSKENLVDLPVNNVIIRNNITEGGGIKILGEGKGNTIEKNLHTVKNEASIIDKTGAKINENKGYSIDN